AAPAVEILDAPGVAGRFGAVKVFAVLELDDSIDHAGVDDLVALDGVRLDLVAVAVHDVVDHVHAAVIGSENQLAGDAHVDVAVVLEILFQLDAIVVDHGGIEGGAEHPEEGPRVDLRLETLAAGQVVAA